MKFLILFLCILTVICKECEFSDFASTYGECENNKRLIIFYKRNPCDGGIAVPPSTSSIPCDLTCKNGQFLKAPFTSCHDCESGFWSFSEGTKIETWDPKNLPDGIRTSCYPRGNCQEWKFQNRYVVSGDSGISTLEHDFEIVREDAKLIFPLRMDGGFLEMFVNGDSKKKWTKTVGFEDYSFDLDKGFYKIQWKFKRSRSFDRAYIRNLQVLGTRHYQDHCKACPAGFFSSERGSSECKVCPRNTWSREGSSKCMDCPKGFYSHEGSSTCLEMRKCTASDYYQHYTPCRNGVRSIVYDWLEPKNCIGGFLPDTVTNRPCECPLGKFRKGDDCIACDKPGTYFTSQKKCEICPKGTAAIKQLEFSNLDVFPQEWKVDCKGICLSDSNGWRIISTTEGYNMLESGPYGEVSLLSFPMNLYTKGGLIIEYMNPNRSTIFSVYLNNTKVANFNTSEKFEKFSMMSLSSGLYKVAIAFEKQDYTDIKTKAFIKSIKIVGEKSGSALECVACPSGYYCPHLADRFEPCKPGESSQYKSSTCSKCPVNTFSHHAGSECIRCGAGTHSKLGSAFCEHNCTFTHNKHLFDLRPLKVDHYGPFETNTRDSFYFNLCDPLKKYTDMHTHSVLKMENKVYDFGGIINYKPTDGDDGVEINFTQGQECLGKRLETIVKISCDLENGKGEPKLVHEQIDPEDICSISPVEYSWKSIHGCYQCTEADIGSTVSECVNGKKTISYFYKAPQRCSGGFAVPAPKTVLCKTCTVYDYTFMDGKCVNNKKTRKYFWKEPKTCTGGVTLPRDETLSCKYAVQMESSTLMWTIVGMIGVVTLFGLALFLMQKGSSMFAKKTNPSAGLYKYDNGETDDFEIESGEKKFSVIFKEETEGNKKFVLDTDSEDDDDDDENLSKDERQKKTLFK